MTRPTATKILSVLPSILLSLCFCGSSDEVVPIERARLTFEAILGAGWDITLREVVTDHAGAIGTIYDPTDHRCVPTVDPIRQELLTTITGWIADFALNA